ncbi:hypothetical protein PN497_19410, partial [Sphaerospermopsis kisseleviana CS-549]
IDRPNASPLQEIILSSNLSSIPRMLNTCTGINSHRAKHSENNLVVKLRIDRPNASPLQEIILSSN